MESNRGAALTAGILFIIATVASILGPQLSQPILEDRDYLTSISAHANQVTVGALLELIAAGACAGIAMSLYSVLKEWNAGLAIGSVAFRTMEAVLYAVGVVSLLCLLAVSRQFAGSGAADPAPFRISGDLLLNVREQVIVPAVAALASAHSCTTWCSMNHN